MKPLRIEWMMHADKDSSDAAVGSCYIQLIRQPHFLLIGDAVAISLLMRIENNE